MTKKNIPTEVEKVVEQALDILHDCVQHTPITLEQTKGSDYDKGYIFYQDMVCRDVLDNTPRLRKLLEDAFTRLEEEKKKAVEEAVKKKKV